MEIYKTTNKITGDFYIGKANNPRYDYVGSGTLIKKQIKKYGKDNFNYEVLCMIKDECTTSRHLLTFIEHLFIKKHIHNKRCLNLSLGSKNSILDFFKEEKTVDLSNFYKLLEQYD